MFYMIVLSFKKIYSKFTNIYIYKKTINISYFFWTNIASNVQILKSVKLKSKLPNLPL